MTVVEKKEIYNINGSYPMLIATCSKQLRESLNKRFAAAGFNVTSEQWVILVYLWHQDGLSQQALADRYERSKVAAFRLIGKLEDQGYVIRRSDPSDGRCKRVFLTDAGRNLVPELIPLAKENKKQAARGISDHDLKIMKQVIKKITENISG